MTFTEITFNQWFDLLLYASWISAVLNLQCFSSFCHAFLGEIIIEESEYIIIIILHYSITFNKERWMETTLGNLVDSSCEHELVYASVYALEDTISLS